jgi:hypothetical protein
MSADDFLIPYIPQLLVIFLKNANDGAKFLVSAPPGQQDQRLIYVKNSPNTDSSVDYAGRQPLRILNKFASLTQIGKNLEKNHNLGGIYNPECSGPDHFGRHRHEDRLDIAVGLEAEGRAPVI